MIMEITEGSFTGGNFQMPKLIKKPEIIETMVEISEKIEEYVGRLNTGTEQISVAKRCAPKGWQLPGQRASFQEILVVLKGCLRVEHTDGVVEVRAGQAIIESPGEWIRHSAPYKEGVEYMAICTPAFSPDKIKRDID
jgi:quercetin dioxygenase-like cupin family protein